jgi:alcohol dehydrogenase (cytochrome c)
LNDHRLNDYRLKGGRLRARLKGDFMVRTALVVSMVAAVAIGSAALAQQPARPYRPVTQDMLQNPSPDDWLMFSRTYDAQRFSPLREITRQNVNQLKLAWSKTMATGVVESIPIVHDGVMFAMTTGSSSPAGGVLWALDATTGRLLWEFRRGGVRNSKSFAIYDDMVFYPASDGSIVALDARTGEIRWETRAVNGGQLTGGLVMAGDRILSGRTCTAQAGCYIAAHDARTGKELWKFYTAAGADDPVGDRSWGGAPVEGRRASTWGLTGSYDPERRLAIWGVANPVPNTRAARHQGNSDAIGLSAPADLYSNSTVALDVETGRLQWYFQHLPGDDWDQDYTNERILLRTRIDPSPQAVKWIGGDIPRNEQRDVSVSVGEGGGLFVLDRTNGKFLWAIPFPYDAPNFLIKRIDPDGTTWINDDVMVDRPGERHVICAYNTKSYWPMAYNPPRNALYVQYVDNCLDMTSAVPAGQTAVENAPVEPQPNPVCTGLTPAEQQAALALNPPADAPAAGNAAPAGAGAGRRGTGARGAAPAGGGRRGGGGGGAGERRIAIRRAGSDPAKFSGIARVDMATGQLTRFFETCAPTNGAVLTTAGDLVFFGDLAQRFRAMDADSGKVLWEVPLPGSIQSSTITYAVDGRQYVAVVAGRGAVTAGLINQANIQPPPQNTNGLYVFALPD